MTASLWTVQEFASVMRVDTRTVRRWQSAGEVRVVRVGGVVRVPSTEVDRLTSSERAQPASPAAPSPGPAPSAARRR